MECKIFVGLFLLAVLRQVAGVSICPTREIQATEGEVTSPNYPNNYDPDEDCSLTIDGGSGARFTVKFLDFRVEEDDDDPTACQYDVFAIIDGSRTVKYCGSGKPPDFKSTRNKIVLKFKSDSNYEMEGFKVTFTSEVEKRPNLSGVSICPSKTIKVNPPEKMKGSFYTPNHPDDYPNNEKCAVILDVPDNYKTTIWFQKFELQYSLSCDFDQLVLSDELQSSTQCGGNANQLPPPLQLKGRQVKMAFSSDETSTAGGFQLHYNVTRLEEGRCICTSGLSYFTISNYKSKSNRQEDDVRFEFKSTQSSGMIMYAKGFYRDYIYIGYKNGNLLFYNINLGTGEGKIQTINLKLNDGKWHKVHVTRKNRALTISIDNGRASVVGQTRGPFNRLDIPTSTGYFLGAPRNLKLEANFFGCIRDFSVDGIEPITNAKADKPDYSAVRKALARECSPSDLQ